MHPQKISPCVWYQSRMLLAAVALTSFVGCDIRSFVKNIEPVESPAAPMQSSPEFQAMDAAKIEEAIQKISVLTQQAVQSSPANYDMLLEAGAIAESLVPYVDAFDPAAKPLISQALYYQACGYSIKKDLDRAFKALDESIVLGFDDKKLMESDTDLNNLREDPRYRKMIEKLDEIAKSIIEKRIEEFFLSTSPYPFDFQLENLEGNRISLKDIQGKKATIVDFWGTWCPPCRMEIPHFIALQKRFGEQGLQVIGINYERGTKEENIAEIKEYSAEAGIDYPLVLGDDTTRNQLPDFRGYPTTLFLDSRGIVRAQTVGYVSEEILEGIVKRILEKSGY